MVVQKHKLETLVRREFRCHEGSCGYKKRHGLKLALASVSTGGKERREKEGGAS